jgi:DNA-binding transcriptional ArsR family regulator
MSQNGSATYDRTASMTADDVAQQFSAFVETMEERGIDGDPFTALFTPRARGRLLHVMLGVSEPLTASEVCDRYDIARMTFSDHIDVLVAAGVVEATGKRGNAQTYAPNLAHPVVQLLRMAETAQRHGVTPDLLDEQFVGDPAAAGDDVGGGE